MAFQLNGFQRNAFQIGYAALQAAGRLKKRLRRNTRIKALADELAEKYKSSVEKEALIEIVKPFVKELTFEDYYEAPKVEEINFESLAKNINARKSFLNTAKLIAQQEEEEMALMLLLANG